MQQWHCRKRKAARVTHDGKVSTAGVQPTQESVYLSKIIKHPHYPCLIGLHRNQSGGLTYLEQVQNAHQFCAQCVQCTLHQSVLLRPSGEPHRFHAVSLHISTGKMVNGSETDPLTG
jgi:hypothetical protein